MGERPVDTAQAPGWTGELLTIREHLEEAAQRQADSGREANANQQRAAQMAAQDALVHALIAHSMAMVNAADGVLEFAVGWSRG